ncbi:MAG: citramalate synthase [Clostridiales bacterium]|nr:citramalate synthase [Clostridiales bacterium]
MNKKVYIFDTTLRDGAQAEGISFSTQDRLDILTALDELGIDFVEAGNPASNPKEAEFFEHAKNLKLKSTKLVAFGNTRRKGVSPREDTSCLSLLDAGTLYVSVVGKCHTGQVRDILGVTQEENLAMIEDTCRFLTDNGKKVIFDAEHFYDGYKSDPVYAVDALRAAARGGAFCLCLCDTNGGAFPSEIFEITGKISAEFKDLSIGIHAHNDGDMATANAVSGVRAGATQVQGTFLGFGERTGNTALTSVIPNLQLKLGFECIPPENMQNLVSAAISIAETANISLRKNLPFVGRSAFAHKAGMHADAVLKSAGSFEHINPDLIGNKRRFLVSEMSGKAAILRKINKYYPDIDKDSPAVEKIVGIIKDKEHNGYQYEGADASLELTIRKVVEGVPSFFDLISYKVLDELPYDNNHSATATIKLTVNGVLKIAASDGEGPVNALDKALREALSDFYPKLTKVHLIDYKVRVIEPKDATAAQVRVLITSTDGSEVWTTVGLSQDIIEASFTALTDSIEHILIKK